MSPIEARLASIGGTRQMIADDQFNALVAVLVRCNAVPADAMAIALRTLASDLASKADGQTDTDWIVHRPEAADRIRGIERLAADLERSAADRARP